MAAKSNRPRKTVSDSTPLPGTAAVLYEQKIHPRLLIGPSEVSRLRHQIQSGWAGKIMAGLRTKVDGLIQSVEQTDDMAGLLAHHVVRTDPMGGHVLEGAGDIAMVALLDENPRARDAVRKILHAIPDAEKLGPRDSYSAGYASWGTLQMAYDLTFNHLRADEQMRFARWAAKISVRHTLKVLQRQIFFRAAGANVQMVGMIAALLSLLAIEGDPGAGDLSRAKKRLLEFFEVSMFSVMGREGYPFEDIGYGSGMVSLLARVVEATRRAGLYDAYAQCSRYTRFGQAMLHFVQPWGQVLSNTGDYGADFGWRSMVFPRLAAMTNDPSLLWLHGTLSYPIASSGPIDMKFRRIGFPELSLAKGFQVPVDLYSLITIDDLEKPVHPSKTDTPTHYHDPDRGIVTFRSDWDEDATFVVFDGSQRSPSAAGHHHDSGGHFSLSALGEYFAIDTGRYNIEQEHHNVVIVDGKSGHTGDGTWRCSSYEAKLTGWNPGEFVDTASVDSSQMSNCYWARRTIGLVKGTGAPAYVWTVDDVNADNDFHEFWWLMNVHPDSRIELHKTWASVIGAYHGNRLDVHFALPAPDEFPIPHTLELDEHIQFGGSNKEFGGSDQHQRAQEYRKQVGLLEWGPAFERPRLDAKVKGYNGRFMSLMIPRLKGAPRPKVKRLPSLPSSLAMRITFDKVEDTIVWAYEHQMLEAGEVRARGKWCVVRQSRKTGRVLNHAMGEGESLIVGDKKIC